GPGRVELFRNFGIQLVNSTGGTIADVTVATNCMSGIFVSGGSANNVVERNVSIRNGHLTAACGGIESRAQMATRSVRTGKLETDFWPQGTTSESDLPVHRPTTW